MMSFISGRARAGRKASFFCCMRAGFMPEAGDQVIVYQADGLHMRVNYCCPDEFEAARPEVGAERVRLF